MGQASFWNSKKLVFQNEAWSSLDQLNDGSDVALPTFPLTPVDFEYMALPQV